MCSSNLNWNWLSEQETAQSFYLQLNRSLLERCHFLVCPDKNNQTAVKVVTKCASSTAPCTEAPFHPFTVWMQRCSQAILAWYCSSLLKPSVTLNHVQWEEVAEHPRQISWKIQIRYRKKEKDGLKPSFRGLFFSFPVFRGIFLRMSSRLSLLLVLCCPQKVDRGYGGSFPLAWPKGFSTQLKRVKLSSVTHFQCVWGPGLL